MSLNGERVEVGECVSVKPDDPSTPLYIARLIYMWEEASGSKMFHGHWFRFVIAGGKHSVEEGYQPVLDFLNFVLLFGFMVKSRL